LTDQLPSIHFTQYVRYISINYHFVNCHYLRGTEEEQQAVAAILVWIAERWF